MTPSCQALHRALRDLEAYAERAVGQGGVDPKFDATWIILASAVHSGHETWALERNLPTLENLLHWKARLESWARNLAFHLADHRRVAEWLCHVDIVKSLADWPSCVEVPLEPWWHPNVRPWEILVPRAAWKGASGDIEDDSWIVETSATLLHYQPVTKAAQPHLVACQRERATSSRPFLGDSCNNGFTAVDAGPSTRSSLRRECPNLNNGNPTRWMNSEAFRITFSALGVYQG